jgi:hypothetical protein
LPIIIVITIDVFAAIAISTITFAILDYLLVVYYYKYFSSIAEFTYILPKIAKAIQNNWLELSEPSGYHFPPIFFMSTLFTSIWTILVAVASLVLRLLVPIQTFTAWFFDVERHPVQAIGIIAGGLVIISSLIWKVLEIVVQ